MTLTALREWLEVLAEADATIPAQRVLDRLPVTEDGAGDDLAALDVEQAGEALGRSPSTVRQYARSGLLPGSFRQMGREWRIPVAAIRQFRAAQAAQATAKVTTVTGRNSVSLDAWRREHLA